MFFVKTVCISILFLISAFKIRDSKGAETCEDGEAVYSFCDPWMSYNTTIYIECMGGKGYDIKTYMSKCSKEENLPAEVGTFCNPNDKKRSIKLLCCTLVLANQQQPEKGESYIMDSARICIDQMIKQTKDQ